MNTIDDYINAARENQKLPSDRQLALKLDINPTAISAWRTKRAWPSDDLMLQLAELAKIDTTTALLDLNCWRTYDTPAHRIYWTLKEKITHITVIIIIACLLSVHAAIAQQPKIASAGCQIGYIMENEIRLIVKNILNLINLLNTII